MRERNLLASPDPTLHKTGSEGLDGNRRQNELRLLQHFGMLPTADVLDIGCGIGRLAYECAGFLDDDATYTGFDIAPQAIEWLNANYAPHLPGFKFDLLDVHNERYRPEGEVSPDAVRFPYGDESFDVACAFEVFMHLPLEGVANYLREISRVLRPGGLAVVTLVVVHPGEEPPSFFRRPYRRVGNGVYSRSPRRQNVSMAYDIGLVRPLLAEAGLDEVDLIKGRIHIPWASRPGVAEGIAIPPLSHACDLFAARRSGTTGDR